MSLQNESNHLEHTIPNQSRSGDRGNSASKVKIILSLLSIILWVGLIYGGYFFAVDYFEESNAYLDEKIEEVKLQNETALTELQRFNEELQYSTDELALIKDELAYLKESLQLTGESITGGDETRLAIEERMKELDKQLAELQKQLVKLEEAARAH